MSFTGVKKVRRTGGLGPDPEDLQIVFGSNITPTFKLDNENFYLNTIKRTDPNLKYFGSFFSRNFYCDECNVLNGVTYTNSYSFDIVSLLNIGKIVYFGKMFTLNETIRDALNACELLYPNVPDSMFDPRDLSINNVTIYGNLLFTSGGQNLLKRPTEYLNSIMSTTSENVTRTAIKDMLVRKGRSNIETLFPNSSFSGGNLNAITLTGVTAFTTGELLKLLLSYCEFLSEHPETGHASIRGA